MEMSKGIGIKGWVPGNTFAISSRLCLSFRLKGEIGGCRRSSGNRDFLRLGTGCFLPRRHGVVSRRDVVDGVVAARIGSWVGPFYHRVPTGHPGMDIAFHFDKLPSFPAFLAR